MSSNFFNRTTYTAVMLAAMLGLQACNSAGTDKKTKTQDALDVSGENKAEDAPVDYSNELRAFCPKTVIRSGTETYRTFTDGIKKEDEGALNHLEYQATISETVRECNYSPNNLNIRVGVRGRVINGPTGVTGTITAPVRVAVVNTAQEVLFSQLHQVAVTIPEGGTFARFSLVESGINVPVPKIPNLIIYVGFDEGPPS